MDSPARSRLRKKFEEVPENTKFQMVNSVFGGAVPYGRTFLKKTHSDYNAQDVASNEWVKIRSEQEVELLE